MTGKVFGIPLAIILLVLLIAALVNVPMFYLYEKTMNELEMVKVEISNLSVKETKPKLQKEVAPTIESTPSEKPFDQSLE